MRMSKFILILLTILILQACLPTMQIEKSGIINSRGVDLLEEDDKNIIETTIIPYLFDPKAPNITSILIGRGNTIKEARDEAGKQSSYMLAPGQIRLEIYGKEAAEHGILPFINTLIRDARVSETMQLAVTDLTAKEILFSEQGSIPINTSEYLQDLMKKEVKRNSLPSNSLHDFTRLVEHVGADPVLPVVDIVEERPTLVGAAVFKGDKYVEAISMDEAFLINMIIKRVRETLLDASVPLENYKDKITYSEDGADGEVYSEEDSIYVALSLQKGKGKLKLVDEDNLHYKADIKMRVELLETSIPMKINTEETVERLEQDLERYYKGHYEQLFKKLQEAESDALGLGRIYTSTRKGSRIKNDEWYKKYADATVEFNVDLSIVDYGTVN